MAHRSKKGASAPKPVTSAWTPQSEKQLAKLFPKSTWPKLLQAFPGRTRAAINQKAREMNLSRSGAERPDVVSNWTGEMEKRLKRMYPTATKGEVLEAFSGFSWEAVQTKARRLGLKRGGTSDHAIDAAIKSWREFAQTYNDFDHYPLIHDLVRNLFGKHSTVKDKRKLLDRAVAHYHKFRKAHSDEGLSQLIVRNHKDGTYVPMPPGVMAQLDEFRMSAKLLKRPKGIVVTTAALGARLNDSLWENLECITKHYGYILPVMSITYGAIKMKKVKETQDRELTSTFDEKLKGHMIFDSTSFAGGMLTLNALPLRPTLDRFLVDRICERGGNASQIFAGPKLELEHRQRLQHDYPKAIWMTGAVTHPNYVANPMGQQSRTAQLAMAEHTYAALIIEFTGKKTFHIRPIHANTEGDFFDIDPVRGGGVFVSKGKIAHVRDAVDSLVCGDWHVEETDPVVRRVTVKDMIPKLRPKRVVFHDFFNGHSVSHWDDDHALRLAFLTEKGYRSVERELQAVVEEYKWIHKLNPDVQLTDIASNHPEFLGRYLKSKRFMDEPQNMGFCADLFGKLYYELKERDPQLFELASKDPVQWWLDQHVPFVETIARNETLMLPDNPEATKAINCGFHGDLSPGGMRTFGLVPFRKCNQWVTIGHGHSAQIWGPVQRVGTSTRLTASYVHAPGTNWTNTHQVIFKNGQRMLINIVNGKWHGRGERRKRTKRAA